MVVRAHILFWGVTHITGFEIDGEEVEKKIKFHQELLGFSTLAAYSHLHSCCIHPQSSISTLILSFLVETNHFGIQKRSWYSTLPFFDTIRIKRQWWSDSYYESTHAPVVVVPHHTRLAYDFDMTWDRELFHCLRLYVITPTTKVIWWKKKKQPQ